MLIYRHATWVVVCNNTYRYEHNFFSLYRNPTILEMVSIASKCVNMDLIVNLFLLKYNKWIILMTKIRSVKKSFNNTDLLRH